MSHTATGNVQEYYRRITDVDIGRVARELLAERIVQADDHLLQCDCPHHQSSSHRSLHVLLDKQAFYCFGCGVGGDVLQLVEFIQSGTVTAGQSGPMPETHQRAATFWPPRPLCHRSASTGFPRASEGDRVGAEAGGARPGSPDGTGGVLPPAAQGSTGSPGLATHPLRDLRRHDRFARHRLCRQRSLQGQRQAIPWRPLRSDQAGESLQRRRAGRHRRVPYRPSRRSVPLLREPHRLPVLEPWPRGLHDRTPDALDSRQAMGAE